MFPGKIELKQGPLLVISCLTLFYIFLVVRGWRSTVDDVKDVKLWKKSSIWLEDNEEHRNPHKFSYLMNPEDKVCGDPRESQVNLLVLVTSALTHADRRRAIRETWGDSLRLDKVKVKVLFLLGTTEKKDVDLEQELTSENENYEDLLREDFLDSYQNLTLKTLGGVKWAAIFCPQARHVMKTDDDMFVNINLLRNHLDDQDSERTITGCIKNGPEGAPQPVGGPGASFRSVHPLFTAGAGYILSGDLLEPLYRASLDLKLIRVEDAFLTGYCARKVGDVKKVHNKNFSCGQLVDRDCDMKTKMTGHKVTPERMKDIHRKLENKLC